MYRENVFECMKKGDVRLEYDGSAILFLPKNGGLSSYVEKIVPEIGLGEYQDSLGQLKKGEISKLKIDEPIEVELRYVRGEDIPYLVEQYNGRPLTGDARKFAFGLTGDDLFDEALLKNGCPKVKPTSILNTYDWFDPSARYMRPALCLINESGDMGDLTDSEKKVVAVNNKYLFTSKRNLDRLLGDGKYSLEAYNGGTEQLVSDGMADACVDIVYSGKSIDRLGMKVVGKPLRFSDLILIGPNPNYLGDAFGEELNQIYRRKMNPVEGSYTTALMNDPKKIRSKLNEEAAEVFCAIELVKLGFADESKIASESCDVVYSLGTTMTAFDIDPSDMARELIRRQKK